MEQKNPHIRLIAFLLVISTLLTIAGTVEAFEIKVTGNAHSVPLEAGLPQNTTKYGNTTNPVPTPTVVPYETKNISTYYSMIAGRNENRNDVLDQLVTMLNRSMKQNNPLLKPVSQVTPNLTGSAVNTINGSSPGPELSPSPMNPLQNDSLNDTNISHNIPLNATINQTANTTLVPEAPPVPIPAELPLSVTVKEILDNGTIAWIDHFGGFYGIVADNGVHYLPGRIDPLFQVNGLRVTFHGIEKPDKADDRQWGVPISLIELVQVGSVREREISSNGTIRFIDLENGFFGIKADTGDEYLPVNLNTSYEIDGLRVFFSAYPANVSTIAMWGTPIRLITIGLTGEPIDTNITMTGNVTWVNLGGGFYGIVGDDGVLYIPTEIDKEFRKNQFHVNFTAEKINENVNKLRIWGVPVRLLELKEYIG
jgi:hypothetical protein